MAKKICEQDIGGANSHLSRSLKACNKAIKASKISKEVLKTMFEQLQFHEATLLKMWNQPLVRKNEINISNYKEFHINLFKVKGGYTLKKC